MTTEVLHSGSHVLHGSESLCKMLQYLTHQALSNPGVSVKEYQIATEVFGRPSDFDPHLDATVRVRAGRLRSKLAEYYGGVGMTIALWRSCPKAVTHFPSIRAWRKSRPEQLQAPMPCWMNSQSHRRPGNSYLSSSFSVFCWR